MIRSTLLKVLTNSRLKAHRRCKRFHYYRYIVGWVPLLESEALRFGTLIHLALEAWWRALMEDPACDPLPAALKVLDQEADEFVRARAEVMMLGYTKRWLPEFAFEVLAVEAEFYAPLRNPETGRESTTWQLGGKLDVLVRDMKGRYVAPGGILFIEHKSSSEDISTGAPYWVRLRVDSQVSTYNAGAAALDYPDADCLYDVLVKPSIKPLKATPEDQRKYTQEKIVKGVLQPSRLYANQRERDETVEEYTDRLIKEIASDETIGTSYAREVIPRRADELRDFGVDVWHEAKEIHESDKAGRYPRNPDACYLYRRSCEYLDVCTGATTINDPTKFLKVDDVHRELTNNVEG